MMEEEKTLDNLPGNFGQTMPSNIRDEDIYNSTRYDKILQTLNKDQENNEDVMLWPGSPKDNSNEFHKNNDYHKIEIRKTHPNVDKSTESSTAESKFFRFSALAKELSGR